MRIARFSSGDRNFRQFLSSIVFVLIFLSKKTCIGVPQISTLPCATHRRRGFLIIIVSRRTPAPPDSVDQSIAQEAEPGGEMDNFFSTLYGGPGGHVNCASVHRKCIVVTENEQAENIFFCLICFVCLCNISSPSEHHACVYKAELDFPVSLAGIAQLLSLAQGVAVASCSNF